MADSDTLVRSANPDGKYSGHVDTDLPSHVLAGRIINLFMQARNARRPLVQSWNKNYRVLRNNYWRPQRPSWMPSPQIPEIFPIIASFVGWMTDQRPAWQVAPYALPHTPYHQFLQSLSMDLSTVLEARWQDDEYEAETEKYIWDSQIYGTGICKVGWDDALAHGQGDITFKRSDPYTIYPDPQATNFHQDPNYIIEARTISLQELDRRFPGAASKFLAGLTLDADEAPTQLGPRPEVPMANPGAIAPVTIPSYSHYGQSRLDTADIEDARVTVLEAWIREHYYDKDTQSVYDTWRVIVVAGNVVLMNESADDLWGHGRHPFIRYVPYDLGEMWGISLVELLTSPQESLNRILAALQHNVELVGNPVFKEGVRSGLQRQQITNRPGTRLSVNDNSTSEWMDPPHLHEMIPELIRYFLQRMEAISGLSAIAKGGAPQGRNAQQVIDAMQEASFVRIRMALRNLEKSLRRSGTILASLVAENYTTPRITAYTGPDGNDRAIALKSNHFYIPGPNGEQPLKFRLNVDVGSQTHTSRQARADQAYTLFGMGAIDEMALLEVVEFPNWKIVAERVMKLKAMGVMQPPGARQRSRRAS